MRRRLIAAAIVTELLLVCVLVALFAARPATSSRAPAAPMRASVPIAAAPLSEPMPRSLDPAVFRFELPFVRRDAAPASYARLIETAATRHALSPALVTAIARVESGLDPRVVSHKGALGLMQVMPKTGERFGVSRHELFEPERNIAAGTAYLAWLRDRYHGDLDLMLAAYNAGEGAVDKYGGIPPYRETQQYVKRVRALLAR